MSRALKELQRRVTAEGWSTVDLAKRLGVSQPTASRLIRGERGPSLALGAKIQTDLLIPIAWWGESEEVGESAAPTFLVDGVVQRGVPRAS